MAEPNKKLGFFLSFKIVETFWPSANVIAPRDASQITNCITYHHQTLTLGTQAFAFIYDGLLMRNTDNPI